jgi:hypothetical protein
VRGMLLLSKRREMAPGSREHDPREQGALKSQRGGSREQRLQQSGAKGWEQVTRWAEAGRKGVGAGSKWGGSREQRDETREQRGWEQGTRCKINM